MSERERRPKGVSAFGGFRSSRASAWTSPTCSSSSIARISRENGFNHPDRTGLETICRNSAFPTRPWTRSKFERSTAKTALCRASKAALRESRSNTDKRILMLRRPFGSIVALLAACAAAPVALLILVGHVHVMPPMWVHFYGVGVSALVATAASVVLTTVGPREQDSRTVIVGGGFALMAALLAVHGLSTPGVILGNNGLIALTGAATLPVGGVVLALAALRPFTGRRAIPRVLAVEAVIGAAIVVLSVLGAAVPSLVPALPEAGSPAAIALFA